MDTSHETLRQASDGADSDDVTCWCGDKVASGRGNLRLGCRCLVHYDCLIGAVQAWSIDINYIQEWGMMCPYVGDCRYRKSLNCTYYISVADIAALIEYGEFLSSTSPGSIKCLDSDTVERFKCMSLEKRHKLTCGCYVRLEDLLQHIRRYFDDVETTQPSKTMDGIPCPNKDKGLCSGGHMEFYVNTDDINKIHSCFDEMSEKRLLPAYSPRSRPANFDTHDLDRFQTY